MSFMTGIKANKAYRLQKSGATEEAKRLYDECFAEGLNDARYVLSYALLMIRDGEYQRAKEFLVKHQKAPGMTGEQRVNLLVDYAACCFRLGDLDKGISTLEQQFRKGETGLIYQTLGYLYVEKYDAVKKPDFAAERAAAEAETAAAETAAAETGDTATETPADEAGDTTGERPAEETVDQTAEGAGNKAAEDGGTAAEAPGEESGPAAASAPEEKQLTPEEEWNAGVEKAEAFLQKAVEYDDEDAICLDNMGQFLYRVKEDKAVAKPYFEKALAIKDTQIDTLYFLSRYDEEAGDRAAAVAKLEKALTGRFSPLNYLTKDMAEQEIARLKGE